MVAFAIFALIKRSAFTGTVSLSTIGVSATIALVLGMVLLVFAIMGLLRLAAAHAPGLALCHRRRRMQTSNVAARGSTA